MGLVTYPAGAELPDMTFTWTDSNGDLIDFSSGYTFTVKVGIPGVAAVFTKTTGITGTGTDPNVTVEWATTGELALLDTATEYQGQVIAQRTSDFKDRVFAFRLFLEPSTA